MKLIAINTKCGLTPNR